MPIAKENQEGDRQEGPSCGQNKSQIQTLGTIPSVSLDLTEPVYGAIYAPEHSWKNRRVSG